FAAQRGALQELEGQRQHPRGRGGGEILEVDRQIVDDEVLDDEAAAAELADPERPVADDRAAYAVQPQLARTWWSGSISTLNKPPVRTSVTVPSNSIRSSLLIRGGE